MSKPFSHYELLAGLFSFPAEGFAEFTQAVFRFLSDKYPESAAELAAFVTYTERTSLLDQQELYTRSFEVQAITTLDIGYVLFGEDYKRGALLANLNRELREADIETGGELSDHLPFVLQLLARTDDDEFREELVAKILAPATRLIMDEFSDEKMGYKVKFYKKQYKTIIDSSEEYQMIYLAALTAYYKVLKKDFNIKKDIINLNSSDFLKSVHSELAVESDKV